MAELSLVSGYTPLFFRVLGALFLLPLGEEGRAFTVKCGLAVIAAFVYGPISVEGVTSINLLQEFAFGVTVSLPCVLLLGGVSLLGDLFDTGRGQNLSVLYDPLHEGHESGMGILLKELLWVQILLTEGLEIVFVKLFRHGAMYPQETVYAELSSILNLVVESIAHGCELFLPWAVLFLLVEFFFGVLSRAIPSLSMHSEVVLIKSAVGYLLFLAIFSATPLLEFASGAATAHGSIPMRGGFLSGGN